MIASILLAVTLIFVFYFATHIYVCKNDFIDGVAFEFMKKSSIKSFLQSKSTIQTGDYSFDRDTYWELEKSDTATFKVSKGYLGKYYFSVENN